MRLASADVLPFEFTDLANTVDQYFDEIKKLGEKCKSPKEISLEPLKTAVASLATSARRYEDALSKVSARGVDKVRDLAALNELLYKTERKATNDQGLPRRPWFKHQIYAPGFYTGYGVKTIPGVREAIEEKQWSELDAQIRNAGAAVAAMAAQIDAAAQILERSY
jgi:N-acetylated-alpha-linked acidic dipeptidase